MQVVMGHSSLEYNYDTVHMSKCVFENEKQRKSDKVMTHIVVNERWRGTNNDKILVLY